MRRFFMGMLCLGLGMAVQAQDEQKKTDQKKTEKKAPAATIKSRPEPTLKVGDAAPALHATKWLQGAEVKSFEKGKVYVMEFWATWCGPCIVMMPHLSELQKEYADKGVTIVGFSAADPNNSQAKVEEFVGKRGAKLQYTFAFADNKTTYGDWMTAAGQNGIPCTFVVDKEGKIAYIGHPMYLDVVLPKVVAGKWDSKTDGEAIKEIEKEVGAVFQATSKPDAAAGLKVIADFESKHPELSKIPYFVSPKINMMLKTEQKTDAKAFADKVIENAAKNDDAAMLGQVAAALTGPAAKKDPELAKAGLAAVLKMGEIVGDKDLSGQVTLARVAFAAGEKAMAKKAAQNAVKAAPDDRTKEQVKKVLKAILEDSSTQ